MRFGKSAAEAEKEPNRGGMGNDFIRYLRDGETTFRILQEPDDWSYYWEHFSPEGFSFACPNDDGATPEICPGCSSENEKMKGVSRKIAFNVLQSYQGKEYVNVYKVGNPVADKIKNRYQRFTTVTDRDYTITKYKGSGDRWDFDVEGNTPSPVDISRYELKDIEQMLADQFDEKWGNRNGSTKGQQVSKGQVIANTRRATVAPQPAQAVVSEEPPFEEKSYQEADLRRMDLEDLLMLIKSDMDMNPPSLLHTSDAVVDWLMELQS